MNAYQSQYLCGFLAKGLQDEQCRTIEDEIFYISQERTKAVEMSLPEHRSNGLDI